MSHTVKDMPINLRPREKALNLGFPALSDSELLALMLGSGMKGINSIDLANQILLATDGLTGLLSMSAEQLMQLKGIKLAKATQLLASLELVRRMNYLHILQNDVLNKPEMVIRWLQKTYGNRPQEYFVAVFLDTRARVRGHSEVFIGSTNSVNIDIRQLFSQAMRAQASSIIVAHNHPSQMTDPSRADVEITNLLQKAGEIMNIPLIDHIIVSYDGYYSFRENGRI